MIWKQSVTDGMEKGRGGLWNEMKVDDHSSLSFATVLVDVDVSPQPLPFPPLLRTQ